jgi:hypothetical protein
MHRLSAILTVSLIALVLLSCSNRPSDVISQKKMVEVLYDIQLAQAVYSDYSRKIDTNDKKQALINDVLDKHKITQAQLDSSMLWYSDNIRLYMEINDSVSNRLKKTRDAFNAQINSRKTRTDYDILPPYFYMDGSVPILSFNIDSTKLKRVNTAMFSWAFDIMGVIPKDTIVVATLYTYKDTIVKNFVSINNDGYYKLLKPELPDSLLQDISGYIRLRKESHANVLVYNINYVDSTLVSTTDTLRSPIERQETINVESDSRIRATEIKNVEEVKMDTELKTIESK